MKNNLFKISGNKDTVNLILFILSCFLVFPFNLTTTPTAGIDPSWMLGINLAFKNNLKWGSEIIFPYGPLGYLSTGVSVFLGKWHVIIFRGFLWVNICLISYEFLNKCFGFSLKSIIINSFCFYSMWGVIEKDTNGLLLLIYLFWLISSIKYENKLIFIFCGILSVLMFYIKIDIGFVAIFLYYLSVLYLAYFYIFRLQLIAFTFVHIVILIIAGVLLNVSLYSYIISGFHLINSYIDAMFLENSRLLIVIVFILILTYVHYVFINHEYIKRDRKNYLILLLIFATYYVMYKHGIVRHKGKYFLVPPFVIFFYVYTFYFLSLKINLIFKYTLSIVIFVNVFILTKAILEDIDASNPLLYRYKLKALGYVNEKIFQRNYVPSLRKSSGIDSAKMFIKLPDRIKALLNGHTVDIVPSEISIIYSNNLNYEPRPVIQSYSNYDLYLDSISSLKYSSLSKPDFILYCAENNEWDATIDDRYPFFDEPMTRMSMVLNYYPVDTFRNYIVLKKRGKPSIFIPFGQSQKVCLLNHWISLPQSTSIQLANIDLNYTIWGKIIRFIYQPPRLKIDFLFKNGEVKTYTVLKPILKNGLLLNKYMSTNSDAINLFLGNINCLTDVKAFRFSGGYFGVKNVYYMDIISGSISNF